MSTVTVGSDQRFMMSEESFTRVSGLFTTSACGRNIRLERPIHLLPRKGEEGSRVVIPAGYFYRIWPLPTSFNKRTGIKFVQAGTVQSQDHLFRALEVRLSTVLQLAYFWGDAFQVTVNCRGGLSQQWYQSMGGKSPIGVAARPNGVFSD